MTTENGKLKPKKGIFGALNPHAEIFKKIQEEQPRWWLLFRDDKELYIDIRKDNYINIYYYGGSVAKVEFKKGFTASIHKKYLGIDSAGYTKLDLEKLTKNQIDTIKARIKMHFSKGDPEKPAEKKIQWSLIIKNPNYIDSELQYSSEDGNLRIDLTELSGGKLSFVELKGITDHRLRNDEIRNSDTPEIITQMKKYKKFIADYTPEIISY